jgi:hypothetical protein
MHGRRLGTDHDLGDPDLAVLRPASVMATAWLRCGAASWRFLWSCCRMAVTGAIAGWGTSVILLPALRSKTSCPADYCRGAPVAATWRKSGASLVLSVPGVIATLRVAVTLTLPAGGAPVARVSATGTGAVRLDGNRPGRPSSRSCCPACTTRLSCGNTGCFHRAPRLLVPGGRLGWYQLLMTSTRSYSMAPWGNDPSPGNL